jgi:hypothetical protein
VLARPRISPKNRTLIFQTDTNFDFYCMTTLSSSSTNLTPRVGPASSHSSTAIAKETQETICHSDSMCRLCGRCEAGGLPVHGMLRGCMEILKDDLLPALKGLEGAKGPAAA